MRRVQPPLLSLFPSLLHSALLFSTHATHPAPHPSLDLEVYLIPFEVNDLAAYIAQHDTWYRRQIFFPFSEAFTTAPSPVHEDLFRASASRARAERVMGAIKSGTARTPLSLYPSLVTDYVRSARHTFPFYVWICECWVAEERGSSRRGAATVGTSLR